MRLIVVPGNQVRYAKSVASKELRLRAVPTKPAGKNLADSLRVTAHFNFLNRVPVVQILPSSTSVDNRIDANRLMLGERASEIERFAFHGNHRLYCQGIS